MLVRDEADVIEYTLRHLATQVDEVIVADNLSTDGTRDILDQLASEGLPLLVQDDSERAYYQSEKTSRLARLALDRGHGWVLPCDADEYWYAPDMRPIRDFADGVVPDVQIVRANLYNHIPTALDRPAARLSTWDTVEPEPNPFRRIGWRKREHQELGKVMCRTRPDLRIGMGNHSASTDGTATVGWGLSIRHYSWRTAGQYLGKIRNGEEAYAATSPDFRVMYGEHWQMWQGKPDEAVVDHFWRWFHSADPAADESLVFDPAPEVPST